MTGLTMDEWTARLLASATADEVLDLGPADGDGAERLVPAAAVRAAVLDPSYADSVRGLRLRGARIDGDLDLAEATIPRPLALVDSMVDAVDLQWARTRTIDLTGSYVGRIRLDWATVDGGVLAGEVRTAGPFRALSAKVEGPLVLSGARLANDDAGSTLCLDGAEVLGGILAEDLECAGEFRALDARLRNQLVLTGSRLSNPDGDALSLQRAEVAGGISAAGLQATGRTSLSSTRVVGGLLLSETQLSCPGDIALDLDGAEVIDAVIADDARITGEVRARAAKLGALELNDAQLVNPDRDALRLDGTEIVGSLIARKVSVSGEVLAIGVSIKGQLILTEATLTSPGGALCLDGASISGGVSANGLQVTGEVRALDAEIGVHLGMRNARITGSEGTALTLERAEVTGAVFLHDLVAKGEVVLRDAKVGAQLNLSGATLTNPTDVALSLESAVLSGDVSAVGMTAEGQVCVLAARCSGLLDLGDARLSSADRSALDLEAAVVPTLILGVDRADGGMDLSGAEIGDLVVNLADDDHTRLGPLTATGWRVRDLHGAPRNDSRFAADWLRSAPRFTAQPWQELAQVYERNGQPADARRTRFRAARLTSDHAAGWHRLVGYVYGAFTGWGYYPLVTAVWLLLVMVAAGGVSVGQREAFAPTFPERAVSAMQAESGSATPPAVPTGATDCADLGGYPCFSPVLYGVTTVTPASAVSASYWTPESGRSGWLPWVLTFLKGAGWLLSVLFVAGLTGILRRS